MYFVKLVDPLDENNTLVVVPGTTYKTSEGLETALADAPAYIEDRLEVAESTYYRATRCAQNEYPDMVFVGAQRSPTLNKRRTPKNYSAVTVSLDVARVNQLDALAKKSGVTRTKMIEILVAEAFDVSENIGEDYYGEHDA
jgi:hypothetical protein